MKTIIENGIANRTIKSITFEFYTGSKKYFISQEGQVYSKNRKGEYREIKLSKFTVYNHLCFAIPKTGVLYENRGVKMVTIPVHRAVYIAFKEDGIYSTEKKYKEIVNHMDGNPQNNNIDNLEKITYRENTLHHKFNKKEFSYVSKLSNQFYFIFKQQIIAKADSAIEASRAGLKYFIENSISIPKYAKFACLS